MTTVNMQHGYKVLTHTYTSPLQDGAPLCDGQIFPVILPAVALDTSARECAAGWNYCATMHEALQIAGLWPDGYPSRVFEVEAGSDAIQRGGKRRASRLTLMRECHEEEIAGGLLTLSQRFAPHAQIMVAEQVAWREALRRPMGDRQIVEELLRQALNLRHLSWTVREFATTKAAWDAWDAWSPGETRGAWEAWVSPENRNDIWSPWDATHSRTPWNAWNARAARDALAHFFMVSQGWMPGHPLRYTTGIREAYASGLALAVPITPTVLGWAMIEPFQASSSKRSDTFP